MSTNRKRNSENLQNSKHRDLLMDVPPELVRKMAARAERMGMSGEEYLRTLVAKDYILNGRNHPLS
jgi:hypothetical protein